MYIYHSCRKNFVNQVRKKQKFNGDNGNKNQRILNVNSRLNENTMSVKILW